MSQFLILVILVVICGIASGFHMQSSKISFATHSVRRFMSEEGTPAKIEPPVAAVVEADFAGTPQDPKLFDMNKRVRLGRSRDQDGKSNIWSIEPKMEVVEEEEGGSLGKNLLVGGLVIAVSLAALPLFSAFSSLFPDPADF